MKLKGYTNVFVAAAMAITMTIAAAAPISASESTRSNVYAESEVTVTVAALNVRSAPSLQGQILGQLAGGTKLTPIAKSADGAWWQITFSGKDAHIYASYAVAGGTYGGTTAVAAGTVRVTSDYLNVRSGPGLGNAIIGKLDGGASVQTTGKSADGAWWKISFNSQDAYIYAAYTSGGGAAAPTVAAAPAPAKNTGGFELGGHIKGLDYLAQMRDIGMTWVKYQAVLPGDIGSAQNVINAAHSNGLKVLIGAKGELWRASDTNFHREFAGYLATLAASGADAIEIWNEPNLDREYGGSGNGQVNPENYVNMMREAYTAIKAANGGTMVIGGASAPTGYFGGNCTTAGCNDDQFLARMAAAGAANYMDCMGAHHNGSMVGPDQTTGAPTGEHYSWYFWGTLNMSYNAFGGRVPLCWTELGYVTGEGIGGLPGGFSWGSATTLDNQAQWLARAAQLSRESGKVRMMIIWNIDFRQWNEDPQAGYSIFRPNGECRACNTLRSVMGR